MIDKDKDKLSDIINEAEYVFIRKTRSFAEAYPRIAELKVEIDESGGFFDNSTWHTSLDHRNFKHAIDCHNPKCYGGGVEIGRIVHEMMNKSETDREETNICRGYEGSPKGRRRFGSCIHIFKSKVHIKYREPASGDRKTT